MKTKLYIFIALSVFQNTFFSQNPGDVGTTNLTAWFKADNLTLGNVTSWSTTFPTGASAIAVTDNSAPYPVAINSPSPFGISNYNTIIDFRTNSNAAIKALQNTTSLNLLDNRNGSSQGTFFGVYYFPMFIRNNNHMMLYNESSGDAIQFRNLGANGRFAIGRGLGVNTSATRNWVENYQPTIISYKGNRSTATSMTTLENSKTFTTSSASQSSGQIGLHFGLMPGNANSPFNGYLHEFIFYNRDLTQLEMNKIHSYLAIKFGITLDNSGGGTQGDYLSSGGQIVWDASVNPSYHKFVIGLARNDNQALHQKQSHSIYDTSRIYVGALNASNLGNNNPINNDSSFIMMGNNRGGMYSSVASVIETPPTPFIDYRLLTEYKITKTNFTDTVSIDFRPGGGGTGFLRHFPDVNCMALLVDDDINFTNATSYDKNDGITFSISSSGIVTASGITNLHLPNDSTVYVTFASATIVNNLGQNIVKCEDDTSFLDAGHPGATYIWNDGSTNQNLSVVTPGLYWVEVSSLGCSERDTIIVADEVISASFTTSDTAGCIPITSNFTDLSTITGGGINIWSWNFGDGGTSTLQNPSHNYPSAGTFSVSLSVTSNLGCTDDTTINAYINAYVLPIADFSLSPIFGSPRDIINFTNLSSGAASWKWYFGDGDSSSLQSPTHTYLDEGVYSITLIVTSADGCMDTTFSQISIKSENFFAPNSFTPGNDNQNETWRIIGLNEVSTYELQIFNRWGELVFSSVDPLEDWDGKHKGELCPSGEYIWKVTFKREEAETTEFTGHLNLIR